MTKPPMNAAAVVANCEAIIAWAEAEAKLCRPIAAAVRIQKTYRRHIGMYGYVAR